MENKDKKETKATETKFVKSQIISSDKYGNRADILNVLLEEEKEYSFSEVEKIIKYFMDKEVK